VIQSIFTFQRSLFLPPKNEDRRGWSPKADRVVVTRARSNHFIILRIGIDESICRSKPLLEIFRDLRDDPGSSLDPM
jgi:hypothetical protein